MSTIRLHDKNSVELFDSKFDELMTEVSQLKESHEIPSLKEKKEYEKIILDYCKQYKRKVYGGFAQNELIKKINPSDAFYDDTNMKDIDIYSPEPIEDLIRLANIFLDKGYKNIEAKEAAHIETYKLFVEFDNVLDVSYVPNNVYHRMPFVEIDGIHFMSAHFTMIDMFRMFTDPYGSGDFRWPKFERFALLQKYYPFKKVTTLLDKIKPPNQKLDILEDIHKFIEDNTKTLMLFGDYAFCHFSEYADSKYTRTLDSYQIISTNYIIDGNNLANLLNKKYDIQIVEYYPFWTYVDYSFDIIYDGHVVVTMCGYNNRCTPVKEVKSTRFFDKTKKESKINLTICAFDVTLMMGMIYQFKARVNKLDKEIEYYYAFISELMEMRNEYLEKHKKNMLSETLFQEFLTDCKGQPHNFEREKYLRRGKKAQKGGPIVWAYRPEKDGKKEPVSTWNFLNSSGNPVNNIKNLNIQLSNKKPKANTREKIDSETV